MHFEREMRVESKMKPTMFSASSSAPSFIDELKGREKLTFQSRHLVQQCVKRNEQVRMRKEEDRRWGADRKKNQRLKRKENKWQTKCMKLLRSPSWQTGRWERRGCKALVCSHGWAPLSPGDENINYQMDLVVRWFSFLIFPVFLILRCANDNVLWMIHWMG